MKAAGIEIQETAAGELSFKAKVKPGAEKAEIINVIGGALKVAVTAPGEKGRANKELLEVASKILGLRKGKLAVVQGATTHDKWIGVDGLTGEDLARRIEEALRK